MRASHFDRLVAGVRQAVEPTALGDRELLDRYVRSRDPAAFEAIVRRHGPQVLATCQKVLPGADADDAFQATFLALARDAKRVRAALGGWLVVVAHRVAVRLRAAERRRAAVQCRHRGPAADVRDPSWREACAILHEELDRLPDSFRKPLVLCYLNGFSRDEAARELGWTPGEFKGRLERGRNRLRSKLARRGLTLSAGLLATVAGSRVGAVPARLIQAVANGNVSDIASAIVRGLRPSALGPAAKALGLVGLAAGVLVAVAAVNPNRPVSAERPGPNEPPPVAKAEGKKPVGPPNADKLHPVEVTGRVLGPDGKPFAGAKLLVIDAEHRPERHESTKADGSFSFTVPAAPRFKYRYVFAMAPGVGCDWAVIPAFTSPGELTLRLPEDVPIRGRILDLEGKPVAGAAIKLEAIDATESGSLDEFLKQYPGPNHEASIYLLQKRLLEGQPLAGLFHATTDSAGKFTLPGIGKDRVPGFIITSKAHAQQAIRVVTRPGLKETYDPGKHRFRVVGPDFALTLPPTRPIAGTVRDAATHKPVAGARVSYQFVAEAAFLRNWHTVETKTDVDGHYTLLGTPAGDAAADRADGLAVKDPVILVDTPADRGYLHYYASMKGDRFAPAKLDVQLKRGILVEGRLTDRDTGKPIRANVWYRPLQQNDTVARTPGYQWLAHGPWAADDTTRTDEEGRYKLTVLPGPGLLHVQTQGLNPIEYPPTRLDPKDKGRVYDSPFGSDPEAIVFKTRGRGGQYGPESLSAYIVIDPKPTESALKTERTLWAGITRKLKVVDREGKPVSAVEATGLNPMDGTVTVGNSPVATGLDPQRPRRLLFRQREQNQFALIELKGTEPQPVEVRLQPMGTITGRVVDKAGKGVPGVAIEPSYQDHPIGTLLNTERRFGEPGRQEVKTDRDGRFKFEGIPGGVKLRLIARHGRSYWYTKTAMTLKPGEVIDLGNWQQE